MKKWSTFYNNIIYKMEYSEPFLRLKGAILKSLFVVHFYYYKTSLRLEDNTFKQESSNRKEKRRQE